MDNEPTYAAIVGAYTLLAPIIVAVWRLFSIRAELQSLITENRHRVEMLERESSHLVEQQRLFLNGLQERLQHVRDRSKQEEEDLDRRLGDLESFIEKTTQFTRRNKN
jgi:predicted nuclease with TOPRIM domain